LLFLLFLPCSTLLLLLLFFVQHYCSSCSIKN
jgi:hypothetical protein